MSIKCGFSSINANWNSQRKTRNPHIHTWWKSGEFIHKNENVEMWKTTLKAKTIHYCCGKLKIA
jgi:hypothetical protein